MQVKIVGYTQPPEGAFIGLDNVQDIIAYCALSEKLNNNINVNNKFFIINCLKLFVKS